VDILLAMDDSTYSSAALERILRQFNARESRVKVVHVVPAPMPIGVPQMAHGYAPEVSAQIGAGAALVEHARIKLQAAGFRVETSVLEGDVAEQIVHAGTQFGADVIIVGSHGRTGIRKFLLGSVAQAVSRNASCTVEIVRLPKAALTLVA
jgi:nucleotide-binding universal stress UspA family protein